MIKDITNHPVWLLLMKPAWSEPARAFASRVVSHACILCSTQSTSCCLPPTSGWIQGLGVLLFSRKSVLLPFFLILSALPRLTPISHNFQISLISVSPRFLAFCFTHVFFSILNINHKIFILVYIYTPLYVLITTEYLSLDIWFLASFLCITCCLRHFLFICSFWVLEKLRYQFCSHWPLLPKDTPTSEPVAFSYFCSLHSQTALDRKSPLLEILLLLGFWCLLPHPVLDLLLFSFWSPICQNSALLSIFLFIYDLQ